MYHELFDEALERYNAKQTRADRRIENYYEKIRSGKQEKPFHEIILQVGNQGRHERRQRRRAAGGGGAGRVYEEPFKSATPNLRVFSAHLHMDEATPHLHIDFVPFTTGSKRGLDTRVSLKQALAAQGFQGGTRGDTEWSQWVRSEKEQLSARDGAPRDRVGGQGHPRQAPVCAGLQEGAAGERRSPPWRRSRRRKRARWRARSGG